MKDYQSSDIRNFAVVGHGSSGKTMLCEAMLAHGGVINRLGSIANGSTVSDYHEDEKKRQISIHASLLHTEWMGKKFNIIDTPGYLDFISDSLGAMRVADFALFVVDASKGVEVGTELVWEYATEYGIPKLIVVNALDNEHANFEKTLEDLKERFGKRVFPMNIPINPGPGFNQVLDVMRSEIVTYKTDGSGAFDENPASDDWNEKVNKLHQELIEYVAESDDTLLEKFFDEGGLSEEEMREGVHGAYQNQAFIPLFCSSAEYNIGVARLMDFIAKFGSSPADLEKVKGLDGKETEVEITRNGSDPVLFVFKTISEPHMGDLSFFRVYSGSVKTGNELYNSARNINERIGQIYILNGKNRTNIESLSAGDLGAVVKLKDTHTGNTLCNAKKAISLQQVAYPKPNIHGALKLKSKGDEDKIALGLSTLHEEDPTFLYRTDPEIHQTIISGQGELHLQVICENLRSRFNVEIELIEPKIPFRETIKSKGESKYRHKKQSGGAGQFAEVWMRIEPKTRDSGVEFTHSLVGQNVDRGFVPSVEKGVNAVCKEGVVAGYHVVDLKVDFYDGKMHPVDSKDVAFQIAGKGAFKEAFKSAKPYLLEPIYKVEIKVPDECLGDVMGDISGRRGRIQGMEAKGNSQIIIAQVPQMELYRYSTTLRSITGGRGIHSEEFSHYEELQRDLEQKVIAASKQPQED